MFLRHNYTGILWAALILLLGAMPPDEFPEQSPFKSFDKVVHFYLYAQFALLLITGFLKQFRFHKIHHNAVAYAFFISITYGIIIELLQNFIFYGRSVELLDMVANFSGTIFGILVFYLIYGKNAG